MGNVQIGGGSRPIKTIKDALKQESESNPNETEEKVKLREELALAYQRRDEIQEKLKELKTDLDSIGIANEEQNSINKAKFAELTKELEELTEGDEGIEGEGNEGEGKEGEGKEGEGKEGEDNEDKKMEKAGGLSVANCQEFVKKEEGSVEGVEDEQTKADKSGSGSMFGWLLDYLKSPFGSSYWEATKKEKCEEVLAAAPPTEEEEKEPSVKPAIAAPTVEEDKGPSVKPETQATAQPTPAAGGRRYTHKNRQNRRNTRKTHGSTH